MTGFAQAVTGRAGTKCVVEIRSLNHRFFEYSARWPQILGAYENEIKEIVRSRVKRGKISVFISMTDAESQREKVTVDEEKIAFYCRFFRRVARRQKLDPRLSLGDIVHLPDIFLVDKDEADASREWARVRKVLAQSLASLVQMKKKEGQALACDLLARIRAMQHAAARIKRLSSGTVSQYQKRLGERVREFARGLEPDPDRLTKEVAIMADRVDITEEVVSLENHLRLFAATVRESGEVGKKLDFIAQEMNREANTIASKSLSFEISKEVVRIKTEIEKIREQVQNIE